MIYAFSNKQILLSRITTSLFIIFEYNNDRKERNDTPTSCLYPLARAGEAVRLQNAFQGLTKKRQLTVYHQLQTYCYAKAYIKHAGNIALFFMSTRNRTTFFDLFSQPGLPGPKSILRLARPPLFNKPQPRARARVCSDTKELPLFNALL